MNNKEILKQEEEKMKMIYSAEPCNLLRGIVFGLLIEALLVGALIGIGYLLALL